MEAINQTAQTAQYPIQKPTTASAYLAAVAIPNSCYDPMDCRWHPLGFYPTKQAAHTACLAFMRLLVFSRRCHCFPASGRQGRIGLFGRWQDYGKV